MIIDGLIIQLRETTYLKFVMQNVLVSYPGTISLKIKIKIFTREEKSKKEEENEKDGKPRRSLWRRKIWRKRRQGRRGGRRQGKRKGKGKTGFANMPNLAYFTPKLFR